jgi:hypothetical protein
MQQLALFYTANAETYWHIMEHLLAVGLENYFHTDGHVGPRYLRLIASSKQVRPKTIAYALSKRRLPASTIAEELAMIKAEYQQDKDNPHWDMKYRALFGLSYARMLKHQLRILDSFTASSKEVSSVVAILKALSTQAELGTVAYAPHRVPKKYLDPELKLKSRVIVRGSYFAFLKLCADYPDAKSTGHLVDELAYLDLLDDLVHHGVVDKHLLITGRLVKKKEGVRRLEQFLWIQLIDTLIPKGRLSFLDLAHEADLKLAFQK